MVIKTLIRRSYICERVLYLQVFYIYTYIFIYIFIFIKVVLIIRGFFCKSFWFSLNTFMYAHTYRHVHAQVLRITITLVFGYCPF